MAQFQYIALDSKGAQTTGSVEASSEADAITQIRGLGYYPTQVVEQGKGTLSASSAKGKKSTKSSKGKTKVKGKGNGKVKPKQMMVFTRQLATLIEAGLPLLKGLKVLEKQEPDPVLKSTIVSLSDSVSGGSSFSESLAQHPKLFNKLFVNMVRAGELGGVLEVVLDRLAEYQEKANKLKNKIVSAMMYPMIVLFITVAILTFMMVVVVPKFRKMFEDMEGLDMPGISKFVFGLSDNLTAIKGGLPVVVWIFLFLGLMYVLFKAWVGTDKGRHTFDGLKLNVPVLGDLQRKSAISRFSRTLGTLVTSGVPILQALNITRDTAGNVVVSKAIETVHGAVKEGESIVTPMQASDVFPPMVISMIDVGEETGKLPDMLLKVAEVYDDEVDNAVTAMTSILEPIMIVFLALVVGTIVIAMFLPLIQMMNAMDDQ